MSPDINKYVLANFDGQDASIVSAILAEATDHSGGLVSDRLLRCALVASRGSLRELKRYVKLLARDYRDVIVAGEYVSIGGRLKQVRDLSQPFECGDT